MTMFAFVTRAPLHAETEGDFVISGGCQYSRAVARQENETTLILCDTATISAGPAGAVIDFGQRGWGRLCSSRVNWPTAERPYRG